MDISDRLTDLLSHNPDAEWLCKCNVETLCLLMSCHSKIGNTDEANRIYRSRLLPLAKQMTKQGMGSAGDLSLAIVFTVFLRELREGSQTEAALSFAREAAIVASKVSINLKGDLAYARKRADLILMIATLLSQLGDNTLALQQAETARIWEECRQNAPDTLERTEHDLAGVWERIGKIHWKCDQFDEALRAFRESAAVEKRAFGRAPLNCGNRMMVDHRYDRLAYWSGLRCDWRGVAAHSKRKTLA